jgi:hypothetical protein
MNPPPQKGEFVNYTPLWVWSSVRSDRSQREMLKAVVAHTQPQWQRDSLLVDVNWLIDRANSLEGLRNDAIHSPLFSVDKSFYGGSSFSDEKIAPAWWLFNPRAKSLSERANLLSEFRYCRDTTIKLADYAQLIDRALVNKRNVWPSRPSLPERQPKKLHQNQRRQTQKQA